MSVIKLWNFLRGYVTILIEGIFVEKFINICIKRQIFLWDAKKKGYNKCLLNVSTEGFKTLRPIAKKSRCKVRIVKRNGLPFIINKYKKRKILGFGIIVFIAVIYMLSSFIWDIDISGNKRIPKEVILSKLNDLGVKRGVLKYKLDSSKISNDIMLKNKEFAWVSVIIKGTKIKVKVSERKIPPNIIPSNAECDIVARRDAQIDTIIAKAGIEKVKSGDFVSKGQVLVSGVIEAKTGDLKKVHALADLSARTWYEASSRVEKVIYHTKKTGKGKSHIYVRLFNKKCTLYKPSIKFSNFEKSSIEKRVAITKDFVLPFEIIIDRFYENNIIKRDINIDLAKQKAAQEAKKKALEQIPKEAKVAEEIVAFKENDKKELFANVIIECYEDVGEEQEILE